jgi:hypothetical protein
VVLERCEQLLNNSNPTLQECGFNLLLVIFFFSFSTLCEVSLSNEDFNIFDFDFTVLSEEEVVRFI